jgi:hypothetical protein
VSLSDDGNTVAIGAPYNDANGGESGRTRVYRFDGSVWVPLGAEIDGDAAGDNSVRYSNASHIVVHVVVLVLGVFGVVVG